MFVAHAAPLDIDPWDLVRVEVPDAPGAVSTSERGSVLLQPPESLPWRPEPWGEPDAYEAWEAAEALQTEPWWEAGYDGSGVKVAVFDYLWAGADLRQAELGEPSLHDCVAHPSCDGPFDPLRPDYTFEEGAHGVACAEVIHDLAPGVELHLVRVSGLTSLENAVPWAVREGIDLISMSLSFYQESFYDGTGPINDLMDQLAAGGVLMVSSAGNSAEEHWQEVFTDADGDGWHEFDGDSEYLAVWLGVGSTRVLLAWDEFDDCGRTDLDLYVVDSRTDVVGWSAARQVPEGGEDGQSCSPTERAAAVAQAEGWHWVRIRREGSGGNPEFSLFTRRAELYRSHPGHAIVDPGSHPSVLSVGAVRANSSYLFNAPESFSSEGPTNNGLAKPDIAGPDGLSTSVYGPTGFYGTSASTPAVVGALALLMSEDPRLGPYEAAERLRADAVLDAAVWQTPDPGLGAGRARLPPPDEPAAGGAGCARRAVPALPLLWFGIARRRRGLP